MSERVGFIGLGIMGKPMARNLLRAGFSLTVHNRSRAAVEELVGEGAQAANSPAEVARLSDVIITMLPDSPDVTSVIGGNAGVLEGAHPGSLIVDMSTIAPRVAQELAERAAARGMNMLDAPVSGGDTGAVAGTLSIMVGGEESAFERALPLFKAMGKTIVHIGKSGAGQIVKACNQIVVALTIEAVSEALVLGAKAGVDPKKILQVLGGGLAANRVMELRGPTMIEHNFTPGFKVRLHHKDLGIALITGSQLGVPLPVTSIVDQFLTALLADAKGDLDHSSLLTIVEGLAHHQVSS